MRPISILNVEGRIFFSLVEKRLSTYMTLNGYIKRWQQKAFMVEVAGCIEHSTLIFEALKEAKEEYRSICLAMLDFANAYGSIRHNVIHFAMEWSHLGFANSYSVITTESLLLWSRKIGQLTFLPCKLNSFKDVAWSVLPAKKIWVCIQECTNNSRQSKFC